MVTFGDMMSLLLCFFVILVALSEVQEDKFEMLVNSLRRGFAYEHSTGHRDSADYNDVFQRLAALLAKDTGAERPRGVRVQSLAGNTFQVTSVKKGERLMINGDVSFDFGRAELKPQCKKVLDQVAELISGVASVMPPGMRLTEFNLSGLTLRLRGEGNPMMLEGFLAALKTNRCILSAELVSIRGGSFEIRCQVLPQDGAKAQAEKPAEPGKEKGK